MLGANELEVGMNLSIRSTVTDKVMTGTVIDVNGMTPGGVTINYDQGGQMVVVDGTKHLWEFELLGEE